ncbi:MAG: hypothetical protein JW749_05040 [Sedimentisphaerales bacterium]|nr:hypothetical protein [Sedimentisphaerales bacterium]
MELEFEDEPKSEDRRYKMNQESPRTSNLVDTTDCLEAISVIRCWKNLLFILIFLALLFLQVSFLLVSLNQVRADEPTAVVVVQPNEGAEPEEMPGPENVESKIEKAAKDIVAEPNFQSKQAWAEPNQPPQKRINLPPVKPKVKHIKAVVRFLNFLLIPSSMIYCLTMLFAMKISLIGRLGGINHITRAFFTSLLFVVLLLPWQLLFSPVFAGAMFTPDELIKDCAAATTMFALACLYLRFTVYWLLVLLLLLFAQVRSMRWARATLRRLEVL